MAAWDTGVTFRRLRLGLLSLAVFRGVLEDDVIAAVARCVELGNRLEADPARPGLEHEYADAYARLVAAGGLEVRRATPTSPPTCAPWSSTTRTPTSGASVRGDTSLRSLRMPRQASSRRLA